MSIKGQLSIWFTVLFGLLILALSTAAYIFIREAAYSRLDAALNVATGATAMSAEHELSEHDAAEGGEADLQLVLTDSGRSILPDTQILVRDGDRNVAYKSGEKAADLRTVPLSELRNGNTYAGLRIACRSLSFAKFGKTYNIYSARPIAPAAAELGRIRAALLVFIPIGLALASLGGYLLAKRSLRPLDQLTQTVDAVTSSDLTARVATRGQADEISLLGRRFNALLDRLEQAFSVQRRFMADASHQIRTPLTVALTAVQVTARDSACSSNELNDLLRMLEKQMLQLRRIVDDMFFLSQSDMASVRFDSKPLDLDEVINEAVREANALSRKKQQSLTVTSLPEARCMGDEDLLKQAVLILLDNAVKFTQEGGSIGVELVRRGRNWVCSVVDNGPGIPKESQGLIFERFFRLNPPGRSANAGAGLGLTIAQSIVEKHGGSILLTESRPGRTAFEIAVPALDESPAPGSYQANSLAVKI